MKYWLILCVLLSFWGFAQETGEVANDQSLSPYFFIPSDNPDIDALPLKSTSAKVNIVGVIADVQIEQVYKNEGQRTLEAVYVFPASTRAAVYGMTMTIGERTIEAVVKEKAQARADYETAHQRRQKRLTLRARAPECL
ncbi:MAG: VIT domain-containing protein [Deinococcales bacterium]